MSELPERRTVLDTQTGGVAYASGYVYALEERLAAVTRERDEARADADRQFALGWEVSAGWAGREDLLHDIGSPQYIKDREAARRLPHSAGESRE
jgi:hypothetical protein